MWRIVIAFENRGRLRANGRGNFCRPILVSGVAEKRGKHSPAIHRWGIKFQRKIHACTRNRFVEDDPEASHLSFSSSSVFLPEVDDPVSLPCSDMTSHQQELLLLTLNLALIFHPSDSRYPNSELAEVLHRPVRSFAFPDESTAGLYLSLAIPLEDPYKSVSVADFFEATYGLPTNTSDGYLLFENVERRRKRRSLDRATLYQVVENKFINYGYQGHECLLRAICETSEHSLRHNGLIGDILHVIFTPTSSRHEPLPQDILQAEVVGRNGGCSDYQPQCPVGLFDLIGVLA